MHAEISPRKTDTVYKYSFVMWIHHARSNGRTTYFGILFPFLFMKDLIEFIVEIAVTVALPISTLGRQMLGVHTQYDIAILWNDFHSNCVYGVRKRYLYDIYYYFSADRSKPDKPLITWNMQIYCYGRIIQYFLF